MKTDFERSSRLLEMPLDLGPRLLLLVTIALLLPVLLAPLWTVAIHAPQYRDGLQLSIYSYKLDGGHDGQDLKEFNSLNREIGMRELSAAGFSEFKWIPFVLGALILLFLRAAVVGRIGTLIDMVVLYLYFSLFSLWSFAYKLHSYGHDLSPASPVKVEPFMPPLIGHKTVADFDVDSYPAAGSYALAASALILAAGLAWAWRRGRSIEAADARTAG